MTSRSHVLEIVENKPFKNTLRSEISQTEEGKYCTISLICGIQKSQTHENRLQWWLPGTGAGG